MLLKKLEIRNVRKVKQADIDFHGPGLQIIQGMNQSGKTTIAQCIALSLEGPKAFVPGMITRGEEQAEICAYTDNELKIRTLIQDSVKQTVFQKEVGGRYVSLSGGVRSFLDSIRSGLEMPWAMKDMTDARIIEILKDRAGITQKIADIDSAIKQKETSRTEVGRDKKKMGTLDPLEPKEHPPAIDDIQEKRKEAAGYLAKEREVLIKGADYIRAACNFSTLADIENMKNVVDATIKSYHKYLDKDTVYTQEELEALEKQLTDWLEAETKAKNFDEYMEKKRQFDELTAEYEALTEEIEALRVQRKKTLAGIRLGVKGLEIGEDNLLYHNQAVRGITDVNRVGNWSTAESVQVFFSIGAAYSGELKTLIVDNAESLDEKTTKAISGWAESAQYLVILLKVASIPDDLEEGIIYVREGEVLTA